MKWEAPNSDRQTTIFCFLVHHVYQYIASLRNIYLRMTYDVDHIHPYLK